MPNARKVRQFEVRAFAVLGSARLRVKFDGAKVFQPADRRLGRRQGRIDERERGPSAEPQTPPRECAIAAAQTPVGEGPRVRRDARRRLADSRDFVAETPTPIRRRSVATGSRRPPQREAKPEQY